MDTTSSRLNVPADFAKTSGTYRLQAWLAMLGLLAFIVLYVGLASYFSYTAYRMLAGAFAGGDRAIGGFFAALPALFLAVFMWKALFFVRAGSTDPGMEISETDEPGLFKFLYEIADEIGAPRPHRVFLSHDVNACVFYDLSILNFVLPSKKNLCIGLGLVNSLGRSEMKAVLAHEFGHFAQRTMAVGSYVYIGGKWGMVQKDDKNHGWQVHHIYEQKFGTDSSWNNLVPVATDVPGRDDDHSPITGWWQKTTVVHPP